MSCPPPGEPEGFTLPEKHGSCSHWRWPSGCGQKVPGTDPGLACLRSLKERFEIIAPPFPQGGPQERLAPRQESPKESCFQRKMDLAAL